MNFPKHIVAAAAFITNSKNEILLVKTERRGWEMAGGQVEEGEDLISAVKREVLEEAGITVEIKKLGAVYSSISQPSKVIIDFFAEHKSGGIRAAHEIQEVKWFSQEEALSAITNETMKYRFEWLLKSNNKIRYAAYSKDPLTVLSEIEIG